MHKQIRLVLEKSKAVCQEVISVIRIFIHHLSIIFESFYRSLQNTSKTMLFINSTDNYESNKLPRNPNLQSQSPPLPTLSHLPIKQRRAVVHAQKLILRYRHPHNGTISPTLTTIIVNQPIITKRPADNFSQRIRKKIGRRVMRKIEVDFATERTNDQKGTELSRKVNKKNKNVGEVERVK